MRTIIIFAILGLFVAYPIAWEEAQPTNWDLYMGRPSADFFIFIFFMFIGLILGVLVGLILGGLLSVIVPMKENETKYKLKALKDKSSVSGSIQGSLFASYGSIEGTLYYMYYYHFEGGFKHGKLEADDTVTVFESISEGEQPVVIYIHDVVKQTWLEPFCVFGSYPKYKEAYLHVPKDSIDETFNLNLE